MSSGSAAAAAPAAAAAASASGSAGAAAAAAPASAPAPTLSAEEERKALAASYGKPMARGENWYVISRKWLQQFCDYTGFNPEKPAETGKAGAPRPGPINNSDIMIAGSNKELKKEITPQDYELLHSTSWALIRMSKTTNTVTLFCFAILISTLR